MKRRLTNHDLHRQPGLLGFSRLNITLRFCAFIMVIVFCVHIIVFCLMNLAASNNWLHSDNQIMLATALLMLLSCLLTGLFFTNVFYIMIFQPLQNLMNAIHEVGHGNFQVRLNSDDPHEIGFLAGAFNQMIEQLGDLETLRSDFIANVSHEFKTPLAAIQGCAALLQDDTLSPSERRQYADLIYNSAKRLSVLSTNILELSRLEHSKVTVERSSFSLDEQLRQALLVLQSDWQQKDIELDLDLQELTYYGSDELLMQVWLNLLGIAIKFSPEGGKVTVLLEKLPAAVAVTVQDEGIGIDEAAQHRIFDKFYQVDTAHKTEGNGLGLAMVKRILDLLQADIEVESQPNQGAAFTVYLPLTVAPKEPKENNSAPLKGSPQK